MRVQLPSDSHLKIALHEMEFSHAIDGEHPIPLVYNPEANWIEVPDNYTSEHVLQVYEEFESDPLYGKPDHHKRAVELLEKDELTEKEEKELRKLERQTLRELLRGR